MPSDEDDQAIATELLREQRAGRPYRRLEGDVEQGYRVQRHFQALAREAYGHGPAIGYKIALTSKAMQTMVGVSEPLAGCVFADRVLANGSAITLSTHNHLGMEFEVAVRFDRALSGDGDSHCADSLHALNPAYAPAYELIDDRHADYSQINAFSVIAENSWNAGVMLGDFSRQPVAASASTRLMIDGVLAGEGVVGDALGHPLEAVAWLANRLNAQGHDLEAGAFVMTGSSIRTTFPDAGQRYHFEVEGLGSVSTQLV